MSISSHPSKRRRLDDGVSALSKPFRSPLRTANRPGETGERTVRVETSTDQNLPSNQTAITKRSRPNNQAPISNHPKPALSTSLSPSKHFKKDPQYLALQKQHSSLLLQLTKLRQSLDTAEQALKITSSNTDAELETLIAKWKLASREAAEEVFRGAKDRVNRMGGVGAWRERSRKQKPGGWDDEDGSRDVNLEKLTQEQREQLEMQREELEAERKRYGESDERARKEDVEERDDDSFTMDMMLQSLNIDLDLIGYDKENQRWC